MSTGSQITDGNDAPTTVKCMSIMLLLVTPCYFTGVQSDNYYCK